MQPVRVMVMGDSAIEAVAAQSDTGKYVAVDVQQGRPAQSPAGAVTKT